MDSASSGDGHYVVIARRYRPQSFEDLVGQEQVARALAKAIETNRVGHAYLFTGARGVGKTSAARILAKAINCVQGPTATPCNECDICRSIVVGEDVDVLEIDGASNRGIDEIRQLRSNVNVRPSRARAKIYIIDEVHMLTTPAFNALLKTLEEPPEHVKFIFCTTDPEKIPITVLSRCQRFDFSPVGIAAIAQRLSQIVEAEKREADDEALAILARRAAGSMRDSQSLLEQLLAVCGERLTVQDVHQLLGTAANGRLDELTAQIVQRDAGGALRVLDEAVQEGVDVGQMAEQLLGYFRDMTSAAVGGDANLLLHCPPDQFDSLQSLGRKIGVPTLLAVLDILDQMLVRIRSTTQVRTLVEVAIIRLCQLEDLQQIANLIEQLGSGAVVSSSSSPSAPAKSSKSSAKAASPGAGKAAEKKTEFRSSTPSETPSEPPVQLDWKPESVASIWKQALDELGDVTADFARSADSVAISAPNTLAVRFGAEYTLHKESCERPERKSRIEQVLRKITGQTIRIDLEVMPHEPKPERSARSKPSRRQRLRDVQKHPLVQQAVELFSAEVVRVDEPPANRPGTTPSD